MDKRWSWLTLVSARLSPRIQRQRCFAGRRTTWRRKSLQRRSIWVTRRMYGRWGFYFLCCCVEVFRLRAIQMIRSCLEKFSEVLFIYLNMSRALHVTSFSQFWSSIHRSASQQNKSSTAPGETAVQSATAGQWQPQPYLGYTTDQWQSTQSISTLWVK